MSEQVRLGDVATFINGDRSKNYPSGQDFVTEGFPFVSATELQGGRVNLDSGKKITLDALNRLRAGKIQQGDILYCLRGTLGKIGIIREAVRGAIASSLTIVRPKPGYSADFIYYYLASKEGQDAALALNNGSAQPNISVRAISELPVVFPNFENQNAIAGMLRALDDKIELNRRMSATLEKMARALYRSWFVDFDPVHARALGQPPAHMDATAATLFPDSFGPDGLPKGWAWTFFDDYYAALETGKRPKGGISSISEGVPSIGAESIKRIGYFDFGKTKFVPRDFFASMKKGHLQEGDILIYKDGGKPGELRPAATFVSKGFPYSEACINEHVFRVRLSDEIGQYFGFLAISSAHCMNQMRELATGVAQPGLNQTAMKALSFILPDNLALVRHFEKIVTPTLDGCNERAGESQTLAALRDTLLPRLISGDLRIREAEKQVEEVV